VLDVGSGQDAHPRADVVVDKYVTDDFERGRGLDLTKPLVVADGHALPFQDDTFGYVIASHVLEHATDPHAFASELARVGDAGFVQVPTRQAELTFGWPFHPWLIDRNADTLIFCPRDELVAPAGKFFHEANVESGVFRLWFGAHRSAWHHSLHWSGSLTVRAEGGSLAEQTATLDVERARQVLPSMGARGPVGPVRDALRCPHDRGSFAASGGRLTCSECDRSYPSPGGVPILLEEAAS
jgi:uncharacterized protein YbaR (Trm112 family)